MDKVYLLYETYSDPWQHYDDIVGVYASQDKANDALWKYSKKAYRGATYRVTEYKVIK